MITIIIADDQKLFATSLKSVLENDDKELSVIGIAGNGKEAVDLAGRLKPDLILMDVRMPIMDGVEAVRILLNEAGKSYSTVRKHISKFMDYYNNKRPHSSLNYLSPNEYEDRYQAGAI